MCFRRCLLPTCVSFYLPDVLFAWCGVVIIYIDVMMYVCSQCRSCLFLIAGRMSLENTTMQISMIELLNYMYSLQHLLCLTYMVQSAFSKSRVKYASFLQGSTKNLPRDCTSTMRPRSLVRKLGLLLIKLLYLIITKNDNPNLVP